MIQLSHNFARHDSTAAIGMCKNVSLFDCYFSCQTDTYFHMILIIPVPVCYGIITEMGVSEMRTVVSVNITGIMSGYG